MRRRIRNTRVNWSVWRASPDARRLRNGGEPHGGVVRFVGEERTEEEYGVRKFGFLIAVLALVSVSAPAFAANPFMDVPSGHWAYDAIGQLAASGVLSGYPDGTYKGNQPATRYEMASRRSPGRLRTSIWPRRANRMWNFSNGWLWNSRMNSMHSA